MHCVCRSGKEIPRRLFRKMEAPTERSGKNGAADDVLISSLCSLRVEEAMDHPGKGPEHSQPTDTLGHRCYLSIVLQNAQTREDSEPIMLRVFRIPHCDQRQLLSPGVRHINRDVEKIFKEKKRGERRSCGLPADCKVSRQRKGHQKLHQSASPYPQRSSEPSKQQMP